MINITPEPITETSPNDSEVVLSVEGVSKKFCRDLKRSLFYGVHDITRELTGTKQKSDKLRTKEFWALDNVSFQLRKGEALGLVGKNGSGKSTLLRIIAGLIKPDCGTVKVKGRVAPLIALSAGFNPILTGRENIYANMSILGLSTKEIDERFDDVVEFAEIGDAIDSPVQSYSSGMAARLGFASAIHTEPDILLIDEVLAVGDFKFRNKCRRKLSKLKAQGVSFILVSHQSQTILNVCDKAIYLRFGNFCYSGNANEIITQYEEDLGIESAKFSKANALVEFSRKSNNKSFGLDFTYFLLKDSEGNQIDYLETGKPAFLCLGCISNQKWKRIVVHIVVTKIQGEESIEFVLTNSSNQQFFHLDTGEQEIEVYLPFVCLKAGLYKMRISIREDLLNILDDHDGLRVMVKSEFSMGSSQFYQPREWKIKSG